MERRTFLTAALTTMGAAALPSFGAAGSAGTLSSSTPRIRRARDLRIEAAEAVLTRPRVEQRANGDEDAIADYAACFSKSLPHDDLGLVDRAAYRQLLSALHGDEPRAFESVPLGGFARLADPQAANAFELVGCDSCQIAVPPAPSFASSEQAAEYSELVWHALLRDVPFSSFETSQLAAEACDDLTRLTDFRGPKEGGRVTPRSLFRGDTPGDLVGPYVSQFLLKPVPYVPMVIEQRIRTATPGTDYLVSYDDWLRVQNGALTGVNRFAADRAHLRTSRDLGELVHRDFTYQAFLSACLILMKAGTVVDGGHPFKHSRTQGAFSTFGYPFVLALLATVTQLALKACWYQKWLVHRRLRPEEFGGRLHDHLTGRIRYPLSSDLDASLGLHRLHAATGSFLLPQAYPEGAPVHPSYPSGHGAIAGACTTVLKAFFDEDQIVPEPVVADATGQALLPWDGEVLSVGGELDKLASNVALGRNLAGIHWRSDASAGLRLGEAIAIDLLRERKLLSGDLFTGFSFRSFDGALVVV